MTAISTTALDLARLLSGIFNTLPPRGFPGASYDAWKTTDPDEETRPADDDGDGYGPDLEETPADDQMARERQDYERTGEDPFALYREDR